MSEKVLCARQEACPVVLAACERKVMAESSARLAEANLADLNPTFLIIGKLEKVSGRTCGLSASFGNIAA